MTETKSLSGKLALVTGASRGIGAATAEALAAAGAHVVLVARAATALEEIEERIHAAGGTATIAPLDLTDGESIGKLAGAIAERWAALDVLILNAAMLGSLTPVQDIDPKEYSRLLSLNLLANQALIAAFDPLLRRAERAEVVAITSSVGGEARAFWGAYGSSKAALEILLGSYADETAHTGRIRVHIVDPGATRTRMRALAFPGEEPETVKPPEVVASAILDRLTGQSATGEKVRVDARL
jgi:NAD(P)-dependent dehydrogenase (short-subunit alcohol dehydrogenase family)